MSIIKGCQEGKATPRLVEVFCPKCREIMEVFVHMGSANTGRTAAAETCDACGAIVPEGMNLSDLQQA